MASKGARYKAHLGSLFCSERPSCIGQLASQALVSNNLGQAAQGTDVRCDANVDFLT